jgi:mono/diheme cytochrome c family protein
MKLVYMAGLFALAVLFSFFIGCNQPAGKNEGGGWKAPADADQLTNPLQKTSLTEQEGKEVYNLYCSACHGSSGFGDGGAGANFIRKPANLHERRVTRQTDGALYWKISNGRENMPAFKQSLSEEQRWQLVAYIRRLSTMEAPETIATSLKPGISVEHVMKVDSLAVRILLNPKTKTVWYTTFDGKVFRLKDLDTQTPSAEQVLTVKDHGITRLQGAVFSGNSLFLCGNIDSNLKKSTHGRMFRYDFDSPANSSVVFNTVEYGANKTIYDHGWNALEISPDGKYVYINSGARTDHGEVQDNGGLYPFARDNALTSKIFRIPADARDLLLPNDTAKLKQEGYLFAEGIRNAYDIAFDGQGHLFGVSNSPDYDMPEDMFWIRGQHHYGFPWIMGGIENPQQYADWKPDPETDPFIPANSHSWRVKYFHTDTSFPVPPAGTRFSPGVQNLGPDANEYRGHSGKVLDGDLTGVPVSTFTPHCSPLGLFFDKNRVLAGDLKGDGFVIRYSLGSRSSMMRPFTSQGADLLHLHLMYDSATDNFFVRTNRLVEGFNEPTDAILDGNKVYVIEYGGKGGNIWKITLPADSSSIRNKSKPLHSKR